MRLSTPACVLVLSMLAAAPMAMSAPAGRATYPYSNAGWSKFIADRLPALVAGETFTHAEKHYEITRLHLVRDERVTKWDPAHPGGGFQRGYFSGIIHLRIDGHLTRARISGTGRYGGESGIWEWDRVLMYLPGNRTHDFVTGENR